MCPDGRRPFDLTREEVDEYLAYWQPRWAQAYQDHKDDPPYEPPSDHSTTPDRYFPSPSPSDRGGRPRLFVPIPGTERPVTPPNPPTPPDVNRRPEPITTRSSVVADTQFIELDSSSKARARDSTFAYLRPTSAILKGNRICYSCSCHSADHFQRAALRTLPQRLPN